MGQVGAIEKTLDQEGECSVVRHNIAVCRGAMDALMAEAIEGHIAFTFSNGGAADEQECAADGPGTRVTSAKAEEVGGYYVAGWFSAGGGGVFEQNGDHLVVGVVGSG